MYYDGNRRSALIRRSLRFVVSCPRHVFCRNTQRQAESQKYQKNENEARPSHNHLAGGTGALASGASQLAGLLFHELATVFLLDRDRSRKKNRPVNRQFARNGKNWSTLDPARQIVLVRAGECAGRNRQRTKTVPSLCNRGPSPLNHTGPAQVQEHLNGA